MKTHPMKLSFFFTSVFSLLAGVGCSSTLPDRAQRMQRGYIYYLDGAGGGKPWANWSGGVRSGLLAGGYDGAGEMYSWETGFGLVADQDASNSYKRGKADELAKRIAQFDRECPQAPITLIGLSAGTAIAAFTLEQLPESASVESVVMLSGSLSADYDLSTALQRVNGKMYIFTSQHDDVLQVLLPMTGTADRGADTTQTIGVNGAIPPASATPATRRLYAEKIVQIPWTAEFASYGNRGKHTDSVKAPFVEKYVVPLVKTTGAAAPAAAGRPVPAGKVANPDYARWALSAPGAWTLLEGEQFRAGARQAVSMRLTLVSKTSDSLVVERDIIAADGHESLFDVPRQNFVAALIDPNAHPLTHPRSRIEKLPDEEITVAGRTLRCEGKRITAHAGSADYGHDLRGTVYTNSALPGGIVRIDLEATIDGRPVRINATVREFSTAAGGSTVDRANAAMTSKPAAAQAIHNVLQVTDRLYSGSAPEGDAGFAELRDMGIVTVLSVDGAAPDVERARRFGLRYVHLPVGYGGIDPARRIELARAIRDLPGPIYLHCHHGKHRAPAAAASAVVTLGTLPPDDGIALLKRAGTSPNYPGLYACVRSATVARSAELDAAAADFPEIAPTPGFVRAMVAAQDAFDHLQAIGAAGWITPPDHPDLVPASEAAQLEGLLRALGNDARVTAADAGFRTLMITSQVRASELEQAIVARAPTSELAARFKLIAETCTTCHTRYRDNL